MGYNLKVTHDNVNMKITQTYVGVGERIRIARQMSTMSLNTICALVGMSEQNWYRIENEEQRVEYELIEAIANALSLNIDELLKGDIKYPKPKLTGTLGERIRHYRKLRKAQGQTLGDICKTAGISVQSWNRIERDLQIPVMDTLDNIAKALAIHPTDLA